jgi:hypothetical protein
MRRRWDGRVAVVCVTVGQRRFEVQSASSKPSSIIPCTVCACSASRLHVLEAGRLGQDLGPFGHDGPELVFCV